MSQNAMRKTSSEDITTNAIQRWLMAVFTALHCCVTIIDTVFVTNEQFVSPSSNGKVSRMVWPAAWYPTTSTATPTIVITHEHRFFNFQMTQLLSFLNFSSAWIKLDSLMIIICWEIFDDGFVENDISMHGNTGDFVDNCRRSLPLLRSVNESFCCLVITWPLPHLVEPVSLHTKGAITCQHP